jgi:molybdenum cofactor cytidylyltransferase
VLPPDQPARRVAAVVLAAGAASRFAAGTGSSGPTKVLARLEGKPLLQHVLDAIAMATIRDVLVVSGPDAAALDEAIAWRSEQRVTNPHPELGLASSLQVGLAAAGGLEPEVGAAIVLLADQPRVRAIVIRRIADAWRAGAGPIVAPRYSQDAAPNPVLIDRTVWPLAFALSGDRGLGPILREQQILVHWLPVAGDNPDVDTPADLERLTGEGSA